ncbi:MAG: PCMD domain-containing protein [Odoribacter sp.]|nr:PCMD domain-containing protein [Odoribacter sp.]
MYIHKKVYLFYLFLTILLGCHKILDLGDNDGDGWLSVEFSKDNSLIEVRSDANDYKLEIQKQDGSVVGSFEAADLTDRITLKAGTYKLVATSGESVIADFEKPYYLGEQEITIEKGITKAVTVICSLHNVKVTVGYSEKIQNNFSEYKLEVSNEAENGTLLFAENESRAGYFEPNEGIINWKLTLNNGQETYVVTKTITGVKSRHYYKFNFDIKENGDETEGAFIPGIIVNTETDEIIHDYEIIIGDKTDIPVIYGDGFDLDETMIILDETRGVTGKINVEAQAKIQRLVIRHDSDAVLNLGIPKTFMPITISDELANIIQVAGISWSPTILDEQSIWVDFTDLLNSRKLGLGEHNFSIEVCDAHNRSVTAQIKVNVIPDVEHRAIPVKDYNIWAKFATIEGEWYTVDKPEGLGLQYSLDKDKWIDIENVNIDESRKTISALLKDLGPLTEYYYRTISDSLISESVISFTTDDEFQIPNLNFDDWCTVSNTIYPNFDLSDGNYWWDSGNGGAKSAGKTPTEPEDDDVVSGRAAKLHTEMATVIGIGKLASGNIYTGKYVSTTFSPMGAELDFGRPYPYRPTTLKGYYKYQPGIINEYEGDFGYLRGTQDSCHIYIALCDWSGPFRVKTGSAQFVDLNADDIVAFGEFKDSRTMDAYEEFTINIEYRDITRKPTYILIVATSSKYGDYFTGSTDSILWVDEFELGFEYPEEN